MGETALMAANRYRLRHMAKRGSRRAITTLWLLDRTDKLLSLILIANTLFNAMATALVTTIAIETFGNDDNVITISTGVVAFLLIVFAEISPKVIGASYPEKMRDQKIAVEINLSSNDFILGVKDEAHPITLYRKYGVPFVISTDDAGVSRNNLSGEYVLFASRYKTDYAEVKKLSYDSLRYSFLANDDKQRLLKALDGKFAKFEAEIAAAGQKSKK
jgi:hypothetical protein